MKPCPDTVCRKARLWADISIWIHVEQKGRKKHSSSAPTPSFAKQLWSEMAMRIYVQLKGEENIQALPRHLLSLGKIVSRHFNKDTCATKR